VAAVVRGTDPALRDEYVILGAHFDHLGRSTMGALDPEASTRFTTAPTTTRREPLR
jgi:hypothetical protein